MLGVAGMLGALAGSADARGRPRSDGLVHGCVGNRGGALRIVGGAGRCGARETALAWSAHGPRGRAGRVFGLPGPPGPAGPQGPQGPQGSPGSSYRAGSGLQLNGTTFAIDPTQTQRRVGTCPAFEYMYGVQQAGTAICDFPSGNIPSISTTGGLLTGGGNSGTVTIGLDDSTAQRRLTSSCGQDQALTGVGQDGTPVCSYANSDFVVQHDGSVDTSAAPTSVIDLPNIASGRYLIVATLTGVTDSGPGGPVCTLSAGSDSDSTSSNNNPSAVSMTLLVGHDFSAASTPRLTCYSEFVGTTSSVQNVRVAFSRVGSITNSRG